MKHKTTKATINQQTVNLTKKHTQLKVIELTTNLRGGGFYEN